MLKIPINGTHGYRGASTRVALVQSRSPDLHSMEYAYIGAIRSSTCAELAKCSFGSSLGIREDPEGHSVTSALIAFTEASQVTPKHLQRSSA